MLTADEITALQDTALEIVQPIVRFLLKDISGRIATAGEFTAMAQYEVWKLQELGVSQAQVKAEIKKQLRITNQKLEKLLQQSAEVGNRHDLQALPHAKAVPFAQNQWLQDVVSATVRLTQEGLDNITRTMGMVDPFGNALPLQDVYRNCMDFAFMQVSTGATDYNTAIRLACKNLAEKGVRHIDYESGVSTSLEVAVRRNVMSGLGLMQEQISQHNHDAFGCNGWELSAHAASAPDHEPIQGLQFTDAQYRQLNDSLQRRIGTLNCGHTAFPILYGVSIPIYSKDDLRKLREDNENGITYKGKHYTRYEARQKQRSMEASIRKQRRKILVDEGTGDKEKLLPDQIKLHRKEQEYSRFSKAAGLKIQHDRMEIVGYGAKQGRLVKNVYRNTLTPINAGNTIKAKRNGDSMTNHGIESSIARRHTGKGNPNAIITFGRPLNNRQERLLSLLSNTDATVIVKKKFVKMADLAALTAKTGDEFAMFTRMGERFVIRGTSFNVNITEKIANDMLKDGYRWSGHTHPGYDFRCLVPSDGDIAILKCFDQKCSSIFNSKGQMIIFDREGII